MSGQPAQLDVFVFVDAYIPLEEQFQFGFSCFFGGLYCLFRFFGSGVYTFQRHFLLDVVAERAADAQVYVLELDGFVSKLDMPETSNVLQYFTVDGTKISVRPSGTEPKIKFYIEVKGEMGCPKCYTSADAEAEKKVEAVRKSLGI